MGAIERRGRADQRCQVAVSQGQSLVVEEVVGIGFRGWRGAAEGAAADGGSRGAEAQRELAQKKWHVFK